MARTDTAKRPDAPNNASMTSALRCFRVLELLSEEPFEFGVAEIALALSLPRASAHRLCVTLKDAGFVEPVHASKRYRLTPKSLWVGSGYLRQSPIYRAAFFPMQTLAERVPAPAQLGVLFEGEVLFIHSVGGWEMTDAFADVGLRRPLHATASGKLFLAGMPRAEVKRMMSRKLTKFTPKTIVTFAQMEQELKQIVEQGYAYNDEELLSGFVAIAAPVYDFTQQVAAVISITLSKDQAHGAKAAEYIATLREAARKTSLVLGYNRRATPSLNGRETPPSEPWK